MKNNYEISILLIMPEYSQIHQVIADNLRLAGFRVHTISLSYQHFRYPSPWAWCYAKFKKIMFHDSLIKTQMMCKSLLKQHHDLPDVDYTLFIRGDMFHADFIRAVKKKTRHALVNYQWDGMNRFPYIWQILPLFDRCYTFNPEDIANYPTLFPTTNCYFQHNFTFRQPEKNEFYYIGDHKIDRVSLINQFATYAKQKNWQLNFMVHSHKPDTAKYYPNDNIQLIQQTLSYYDNLEIAKQSRVLVDFVVQEHHGLSLRTFEALAYRKKLISTNAEIVKYDFYHPNNIYVLTEHNFDGLPEFLAQPYHEINEKIREKYSFNNWIRHILNIEPYQAITLPK